MLTPSNQHEWGQQALNVRLQADVQPGPIPLKGCPFKEGDKVIHTKNVYDMREQTVLNGMTGVVTVGGLRQRRADPHGRSGAGSGRRRDCR